MTGIFLILTIFCVSHVLAFRSFFRGHSVEYDIPPPEPRISSRAVVTNVIEQRLDNFDPLNTNVWFQRYYVNKEYYNESLSSPAFLMIGGEGPASQTWLTGGAWIETAKKYRAILFYLEHRFYGASHPFDDVSTENLKYLSSRQALEDTVNFITTMNEEYNLYGSQWIVFGGSYAGSLAAWLRQKYPHLVLGAMSASGPLFAQLDFPEYLDVVAQDLASHSQECVNTVKTAFAKLESLLATPDDTNITELFNLCDDITEVNTDNDIANFLEIITDDFAGIAQYNKNSGRTTSVDDLCDILVNETVGDELQRLARVNKLFYGSSCLDYKYQNTIDYLKDTTKTESGNMRQWIYQTCTEYGWYQTSSQDDHVFGTKFPISYFIGWCEDIFGPEFNASFISEQIRRTNTHFGGYDIDVTNVVFVHGSFDPWHPMGLTETTNSKAPVIFINGTAHCSNMYNPSDDDIPELVAAREEINRLIGEWLGPVSAGFNYHCLSMLNTMLMVLSCFVVSRF